MIKTFLKWLFQSSENPSQIALTLKGVIVAAIPWIVTVAGFFHVQVASTDIASIGNSIVILVQASLTAIGAGIAIYGFVRKLINTFAIPWPTSIDTVSKVGEPVNS